MKLRIRGNSFRFRISSEDLDCLAAEGAVQVNSHVPSAAGVKTLSYSVEVIPEAGESALELSPFEVRLRLCGADLKALQDPSREGVGGRQRWEHEDGKAGVTEFVLEKDRHGGWATGRVGGHSHS